MVRSPEGEFIRDRGVWNNENIGVGMEIVLLVGQGVCSSGNVCRAV